MGILLAHVISLKMDVNKGIKTIMEEISKKVGIPITSVSQVKEPKTVSKELKDLTALYDNNMTETDVLYKWGNSWMTSEQLIESLSTQLFYQGKFILGKAIEIKGITTGEYIAMVDECAAISKKYAKPVQEAVPVGF